MRLLVLCLRALIAIRSRDNAAAFIHAGASSVDLLRIVDLRPFPESAHLGVHRNAHDRVPLEGFELRVRDTLRMPRSAGRQKSE
jgi:hypothetical protein